MNKLIAGLLTIAAMAPGSASWPPAPTLEQMLPSSIECWEPALAVGPREQVYIVAGHRTAPTSSKDFDQVQVLWRSRDGGATFEGPRPIDTDGHRQGDERIAVDRNG